MTDLVPGRARWGSMGEHPLLSLLLEAAAGSFPPVDGQAQFLPPLGSGLEAVVSFTGRAYLVTAMLPEAFADLHPDGYGAALAPAVLQRLAGHGEIGVLDVILVSRGTGGNRLPARADLDDHPRVLHARSLRQQVRVFGDERGVVTVASGLAGRTELSVQTWPDRHGTGRGLIQDALSLVPAGAPVFAAVAPGNARSLRAFVALGFQALGSEVLIRPQRHRC